MLYNFCTKIFFFRVFWSVFKKVKKKSLYFQILGGRVPGFIFMLVLIFSPNALYLPTYQLWGRQTWSFDFWPKYRYPLLTLIALPCYLVKLECTFAINSTIHSAYCTDTILIQLCTNLQLTETRLSMSNCLFLGQKCIYFTECTASLTTLVG